MIKVLFEPDLDCCRHAGTEPELLKMVRKMIQDAFDEGRKFELVMQKGKETSIACAVKGLKNANRKEGE